MFGNLIANRQLKVLRSDQKLDIEPFNQEYLKATHYTLQPGSVLRRRADGRWATVHRFAEDDNPFFLKGNEYVVVEVKQVIRIRTDGIVGRFIPTSSNVESGFLVVAGQIDNKYGSGGERLRFGLKNLLDCENAIRHDTRLAHVEFFDLRGITLDENVLTPQEKTIWSSRKSVAADSGPFYDEG